MPLRANGCRWINGDPPRLENCCGKRVQAGSSYCPKHHKRTVRDEPLKPISIPYETCLTRSGKGRKPVDRTKSAGHEQMAGRTRGRPSLWDREQDDALIALVLSGDQSRTQIAKTMGLSNGQVNGRINKLRAAGRLPAPAEPNPIGRSGIRG